MSKHETTHTESRGERRGRCPPAEERDPQPGKDGETSRGQTLSLQDKRAWVRACLGKGAISTQDSGEVGLEGSWGTGRKALMAQCIWNILWVRGPC